MCKITIISPFHNSEGKCDRLLNTVSRVADDDIEFVFVDDGSTDNTLAILEFFQQSTQANVSVISQENKGPGGARNTGLRAAKGDYVWFVDSDDDIMLESLAEIKKNLKYNFDFIDFNYVSAGVSINSMQLTAGVYSINKTNRELLILNFGRIWTKIIRREFLIKNSILYPEHCVYEDNPLLFIYPFVTKNFMKSDTIAYSYSTEYPSVTRGEPNPKYFDRLYTSVYGFEKGKALATTYKEQRLLEDKLIGLYLINTVGGLSSIKPSLSWISTHKVMKQFRVISKELEIERSYRNLLDNQSTKFKIYFLFHWYLSYLTPRASSKFFEAQRLKAWNKPFNNQDFNKSLL